MLLLLYVEIASSKVKNILCVERLEKEYSTIRTKELEEQVELRVNKVIHSCYLT